VSALRGRAVVITRASDDAAGLVHALEQRGAVPVLVPTIQVQPVEDLSALDRALAELERFGWVVFTSAHAVSVFADRLGDVSRLRTVRVAAVGPGTARRLLERGIRVDHTPAEYVASSIVSGMGHLRGVRVLAPRGDLASDDLLRSLQDGGAVVEAVVVYRNTRVDLPMKARAALERGVDAVTFASASAARNFAALIGQPSRIGMRTVFACIGPRTAKVAREVGFPVTLEAPVHTIAGLVEALEGYFEGMTSGAAS